MAIQSMNTPAAFEGGESGVGQGGGSSAASIFEMIPLAGGKKKKKPEEITDEELEQLAELKIRKAEALENEMLKRFGGVSRESQAKPGFLRF